MTITPEREAELRRLALNRRSYSDLLEALDEARRERDEALEALRELEEWQPHLPIALDQLHPQHRYAVLDARKLTRDWGANRASPLARADSTPHDRGAA